MIGFLAAAALLQGAAIVCFAAGRGHAATRVAPPAAIKPVDPGAPPARP
jgi:hypothetical protein